MVEVSFESRQFGPGSITWITFSSLNYLLPVKKKNDEYYDQNELRG